MGEFGNIKDGGGPAPVGGGPGGDSDLEKSFKGSALNIWYGLQNALAPLWAERNTPNIDVLRSLGAEQKAMELDARRQLEYAALTRDMAQRGMELSRYAVEDPNLIEKLAGGVGSIGPLAGAGLAAAMTRSPTIAIGATLGAESMAEQGVVMQELVSNYGFSPRDAYKASLPVLAANVALNRALPGGSKLIGRLAKASGAEEGLIKKLLPVIGSPRKVAAVIAKAAAPMAAQEAVQEMAQETISGVNVALATGEPISEHVTRERLTDAATVGGLLAAAGGVGGPAVIDAPVARSLSKEGVTAENFDTYVKQRQPGAVAQEMAADTDMEIKESGIDVGATRFRETGDINDWAAHVPRAMKTVPADLRAEIIGIAEAVKSGKGREPRAKEFDIGGRKYMWAALAQGKVGTMLEKVGLFADRNAEMARNQWMQQKAEQAIALTNHMNKRQLQDFARRMESPDHQQDDDVVAMRALLDNILDERNVVRKAAGRDALDRRTNYIPWIPKKSAIKSALGIGEDKSRGWREKKRSNKHFVASSMAREGKMTEEQREMDIAKILDSYIAESAYEIFNDPVIAKNNKIANLMDRYGLKRSAENITTYNNRVWGDQQHKFSEDMSKTPVLRNLASMSKWLRRRLTDAALGGNILWSLTMQPASVSMTLMRYGIRNSMKAVPAAFDQRFRDYAFNNLRGGYEKSREMLGASVQDIGSETSVTGSTRVAKDSKLDVIRSWANYASKQIEMTLYAHGAAAAYFDGKQRGFEGRVLQEWMNDGGSKTQSDYHRADQPGWMHAKELTAAFPFMSYLNEVLNNVREIYAGKTGHYAAFKGDTMTQTVMRRMKRAITFLTFLWLYEELWAEPVGGKRPFRNLFFGDIPSGAMPAEAASALAEATAKSIKHDTGDPLVRWVLRYITPMGGQVNKMWQAAEAISDGGDVDDVAGNPMFNIEDEEAKAMAFGVYSTRAGREKVSKYRPSPLWAIVEASLDKIDSE